jgi:hypothetical protein
MYKKQQKTMFLIVILTSFVWLNLAYGDSAYNTAKLRNIMMGDSSQEQERLKVALNLRLLLSGYSSVPSDQERAKIVLDINVLVRTHFDTLFPVILEIIRSRPDDDNDRQRFVLKKAVIASVVKRSVSSFDESEILIEVIEALCSIGLDSTELLTLSQKHEEEFWVVAYIILCREIETSSKTLTNLQSLYPSFDSDIIIRNIDKLLTLWGGIDRARIITPFMPVTVPLQEGKYIYVDEKGKILDERQEGYHSFYLGWLGDGTLPMPSSADIPHDNLTAALCLYNYSVREYQNLRLRKTLPSRAASATSI